MNKLNLAAVLLTVSAAFLAGMITMKAVQSPSSQANAEMVVSGKSFVALTCRIEDNNEGLFLLDAGSGDLVVYTTDRDGITPLGYENMAEALKKK